MILVDEPDPNHRARQPIMGAFTLTLLAREDTVFPSTPTIALHGALHRAIQRIDPELARRIHSASPSPLTLGPLRRVDETGTPHCMRAGETGIAQVAGLEGETLLALLAGLDGLRWRQLPLVVERPMTIVAVTPVNPVRGGAIPWIGYDDLHAVAGAATFVTLAFSSPVYFRSGGRVIAAPEPVRVFGGNLRRWRAFGGPDLRIDESRIAAEVRFAGEPRGRIEPAPMPGWCEHGFVGEARFAVDGDVTMQRAIATLAAFAAFAGTGARTTMGMGQTRRIR